MKVNHTLLRGTVIALINVSQSIELGPESVGVAFVPKRLAAGEPVRFCDPRVPGQSSKQ
jgi:hypothetical protein